MVYIKEGQHYNSVTQTINDLGWRDLANRRRDTCLMLVYTIMNHEVNVLILAKGRTRKGQAHNKCMDLK